jgi:hypothetical protein
MLVVQALTQRYVVVSQARFIPQLPSERQATHCPAGEQYGLAPPHCASLLQLTQVCVVMLHVSMPPPPALQFVLLRHSTQRCDAVSQ